MNPTNNIPQQDIQPQNASSTPSPSPVSPAQPTAAPVGQVFSASPQPNGDSMPPVSNGAPKKNTKLLLGIGIAIIVIIIVAVAVALSSKNKNKTTSNSGETSQIPESSNTDKTDSTTTAPKQTETAINKTITTDLGVTSTISKVIRNYKSDKLEAGKEFILVYVKEVTSGKYTVISSTTSYKLLSTDGSPINETYYRIGSNELTDAGYPLLYDSQKSGNVLRFLRVGR